MPGSQEELVPATAMENTVHLDTTRTCDIECEVLSNNKKAVAPCGQAAVLGNRPGTRKRRQSTQDFIDAFQPRRSLRRAVLTNVIKRLDQVPLR